MLFPGVALQTKNRQLYSAWFSLVERIRRTIECNEPTNATGVTIPVATLVCQGATANQIVLAADDVNQGMFTGVTEEQIANLHTGIVRYTGPVNVKFSIGLTLTPGQPAFVGHAPGFATNVAPSTPGTYARPIGIILDASGYTTGTGGVCKVMLAPNADVIDTPVG